MVFEIQASMDGFHGYGFRGRARHATSGSELSLYNRQKEFGRKAIWYGMLAPFSECVLDYAVRRAEWMMFLARTT